MAFDFGGLASGIGNLVGAAGAIYGASQSAPNPYKNYPSRPFTGLISTPGYTFGGGQLTQNNNDFLTGIKQQRGLLGNLQNEVRPGYGRLTEAGVNAIRQQGAQASGNLRAQLAQRGLSGASFAEDQLASVANQYSQLENEFRTQAFQQELQASTALIDQQHQNLSLQAQQELGQLGIATGFLQSVPQAMQTQKSIDQALAQQKLIEKYQQPPLAPAAANSNNPAATPAAKPAAKPKSSGYKTVLGGGMR